MVLQLVIKYLNTPYLKFAMKKIILITITLLLSGYLFAQKNNNKPTSTHAVASLSAMKQAILEQKLAEAQQTISQLENEINDIQLLLDYEQLRTQLELEQYNYSGYFTQIDNNNGTKQIEIQFDRFNPCNTCLDLFLNDTIKLKKLFPFIYNGIKNGTIILDTNYANTKAQIQLIKPFPPYDPLDKIIHQKLKAAEYLNLINQINGLKLFDFDVVKAYQKIESAETNKSLANIIQMRKEYIDYLKTSYNEKK